jgi:hypothetical protein
LASSSILFEKGELNQVVKNVMNPHRCSDYKAMKDVEERPSDLPSAAHFFPIVRIDT